jgi:2-(1,2-epoxy-1,2-dihydrophenyl)acetyl-CoA isomerase
MTETFLMEAMDGVLTVTFNRPERLNAFRRTEYHRFRDLLGEIEQDSSVRVVVLTGRGRGFCAGEDLKELDATGAQEDEGLSRENALVLQDITRRIVRSDRVYLAAVNGVAAGFGAELACACDIRVAAEGARFLFPEVRRGLFITNGISYLLPRLVGDNWAATLLLTGDSIDAHVAHRIGLVSHLVPNDSLPVIARETARAIAAHAPTSVRLTKRILRADVEGIERALASEVDHLDAVIASGEYVEGARAFVEKRLPRYRG